MELPATRLVIRPIKAEDAMAVHAYRNHPDVARSQGWIPASPDEIVEYARDSGKQTHDQAQVWHQLVILRSDNKTVVGDCGYMISGDQNDEAEIGISLDPKSQKMGFATEALQRLLLFLFEELKLRRVVASIDPRNRASLALFKRLKFRQEGHFVESLWVKGELVDDVRFALLKREFEQSQAD